MAQVYQFVDDNGVTRLFAEIVPDPAGTPFNGGTITQELIIDTGATTDQALELQGTRTGNVTVLGIDYPHQAVDITSDGVVDIRSDDTQQFNIEGDGDSGAYLTVQNQPGGHSVGIHAHHGARALIVGTNANDGNALLDLTGSAQFVIQEDGTPRIFAHAAPADGALQPGELALWFDQTNGAGKLMVKAKTANGTVATAAIALS